MKFKKKAPLVLFKLDLKFSAPLTFTFDNLAKLEKNIEENYPNSTELFIPNYESGMKFIFGASQTGPIQFISKEKKNNISLFLDGVVFSFQEYPEWKMVKSHIIKILLYLRDIMKCEEVIEIRMEIIDEFRFNPETFSLSKYFTLNFTNPDDWEIDYEDFHIGIKHKTDMKKKMITRLRGIGKKDHLLNIRLENLFLDKVNINIEDINNFEERIEEIHEVIEKIFTKIFTQDLLEHTGGEI